MSLMRRAKLYLGLGADEDYDEYGQRQPMPHAGPEQAPMPQQPPQRETSAAVRTLPNDGPGRRPVAPTPPTPGSAPGSPTGPPVSQRPAGSVVRTVAAPTRTEPTVIIPRSFEDAKEIGDTFKNRQPVIINLQDLPPELGFRLVDFAAGLIFALDGQIKKVTTNVFLLTPANVEVDESAGMGQSDVWE